MHKTFVFSGWGIKESVLNAPKHYIFEEEESVENNLKNTACKVKLIGFSLGAQQALEISKKFPEKILSLHLISWRCFYPEKELLIAKKQLLKDKNAYMKFFYKRCFNLKKDWELFRSKHLEQHLNHFSLNKLLNQLTLFKTDHNNIPFKSITCPIQFIHSKTDKIAPYKELKYYCKKNQLIEHSLGHCPFLSPSFKWS